jgi:hypothetical protein
MWQGLDCVGTTEAGLRELVLQDSVSDESAIWWRPMVAPGKRLLDKFTNFLHYKGCGRRSSFYRGWRNIGVQNRAANHVDFLCTREYANNVTDVVSL